MMRHWSNMDGKAKLKAEFGDFQTPQGLAETICALLSHQGIQPRSLLEPTCGHGALFFAGIKQFSTVEEALGTDINPRYIERAKIDLQQLKLDKKISLTQADFFDTDWKQVLAEMPEPILLLGNPPWVTNAHLGTLGSQNLPVKSNFQNHNGLDARTGKANFDISEWMLIRLMEAMKWRLGTMAMLCKSAVARKVLLHAWKNSMPIERSAVYRIDAQFHFDAAVDAVLLVIRFHPQACDLKATLHPHLSDSNLETTMGYEDGLLLNNLVAYERWKHLSGREGMKWRSGIKHDCSKVMELRRKGDKYINGLDESVEIEETCLYPLLKSSDVAKGKAADGSRWMIVPQKATNEETAHLQNLAPKTWAYLHAHAELLNKRGSSIYRGRPPFSIFGVGDYSFAPWKVAISGFYKKLGFVPVGPFAGKPSVLDDTIYFLPFETKRQAEYVASLLNSSVAREFFGSMVFWDSKRPITVDMLRRLDLRLLARELGSEDMWMELVEELQNVKEEQGTQKAKQLKLWTSPKISI